MEKYKSNGGISLKQWKVCLKKKKLHVMKQWSEIIAVISFCRILRAFSWGCCCRRCLTSSQLYLKNKVVLNVAMFLCWELHCRSS